MGNNPRINIFACGKARAAENPNAGAAGVGGRGNGISMLDLTWLQKTACSGAVAGTEEVQQGNKDTAHEKFTM